MRKFIISFFVLISIVSGTDSVLPEKKAEKNTYVEIREHIISKIQI